MTMAYHKDAPRYNIISMRVSDEERQSLLSIASDLSVNISDMLRTALHLFTQSHQAGNLQQKPH
jgi:hypothetical protein